MKHKITPPQSPTDRNKLCLSQSINYETLKNVKRIQLYYLLEYSVRLLWETMRQEIKNKKIAGLSCVTPLQ